MEIAMSIMKDRSTIPGRWAFGAAATIALAMLTRVLSAAEPAPAVDAQCPWGRLSDGRGRLVRCLTQEEATHLRDAVPAAPPAHSAAPALADAPRPPSSASP